MQVGFEPTIWRMVVSGLTHGSIGPMISIYAWNGIVCHFNFEKRSSTFVTFSTSLLTIMLLNSFFLVAWKPVHPARSFSLSVIGCHFEYIHSGTSNSRCNTGNWKWSRKENAHLLHSHPPSSAYLLRLKALIDTFLCGCINNHDEGVRNRNDKLLFHILRALYERKWTKRKKIPSNHTDHSSGCATTSSLALLTGLRKWKWIVCVWVCYFFTAHILWMICSFAFFSWSHAKATLYSTRKRNKCPWRERQ